MFIRIIKNTLNAKLVTKQKCLDSLKESGLIITDQKNISFTEHHKFSTNMGKNKLKVFYPVLKGQLIIDNYNSTIYWRLNINEIIFKTMLIWIITMLGIEFLIISDWISAFISGFIVGAIIFLLNY